MLRAVSLGQLINVLQKERDTTLMHVGKLVTSTQSFLIKAYSETDQTITNLWLWPPEFEKHADEEFRTKLELLNHIRVFRKRLNEDTEDMRSVIQFYSEIVDFLMDWMITRIKESGFDDNWKTLVAFQKITKCMLQAGAERAYGSLYFAEGFSSDQFENYLGRVHSYIATYKGAFYYSSLVNASSDVNSDQWPVVQAIQHIRQYIYHTNLSFWSLNDTLVNHTYSKNKMAEAYFENLTLRINYLHSLQEILANRIIALIKEHMSRVTVELTAYGVTLGLVVVSLPLIFTLVESLTTNMQHYSKLLVKASDDLNTEKDKTNSLLFRMLPKPVAERLKNRSRVESEFFRSVTVMFASISNFSEIGMSFIAVELVELLNDLYTSIDEHLDKYDVYKVETINDTYMVASG